MSVGKEEDVSSGGGAGGANELLMDTEKSATPQHRRGPEARRIVKSIKKRGVSMNLS